MAGAKGGRTRRAAGAEETGGGEEETGGSGPVAMILAKESVIKALAKSHRSAKQRGSAIAGEYGAEVVEAVEKKHVNRKALSAALKFNDMADEDLAIVLPHFLHYIEVLGIDKRADIQGTMFDKVDTAQDGNVTQIGAAARKVAEAAGELLKN